MAFTGSHPVIKTVRNNSLSRKNIGGGISQRVQLESVLGLTVVSNAGLTFNPASGVVVYSAGCVIVIWDPTNDQQQHLIVPNKRTISALTYSVDGRFLASGECGQLPCIRVWDGNGMQIGELSGHKNGITFVAFSPDAKFLISVGTHHDNLVIVWDWKNGQMVANNKISCKVKGIAFAEDGSFFITVGNRLVKYWTMPAGGQYAKDSREIVPLVGRSAVLGDYKDELFLDVVCGRGACAEYAYAATQSGYLCQFNSRRSMEKLISLKSSAANCLSATEAAIAVGSSDGNVRLYDPVHLTQIRILPHPHHLGVDVSKFISADQLKRRSLSELTFPDCVALAYDDIKGRVTVIYNDHSIYVWDVSCEQTSKLCSHMFHSRCVWGLDIYAPKHPASSALSGTFVTCSSDDTVRIWNLRHSAEVVQPNLFCSATAKILYNDSSLQYLCNKELNPGGVDPQDVHTDSKYGIRCVRIDPYGANIAFGDRTGNIHIYEIKSMQESYKIEAHESEILCLEYSNPESGYEFLASASRDRLIQIFDVKNDFNYIQSLDDHSSSITALRFATLNGARQFGLISCGVDKAVILRTVQCTVEGGPKFMLNDQILSKGGIVYDMAIEPTSQSIITANQDRNLRLYGIKSRKLEKTVKGTATDEGALIKLDLHSTGRFVATSCSDKNLAIIDIMSGDCWASFSGHSEIVTGLRFDQESKRIISVSGDGCVFVWKIGGELTAGGAKFPDISERAHPQLSPSNSLTSQSEFSVSGSDLLDEELPTPLRPSSLHFDDSPLPSWAKGKNVQSPSVDLVISKPSGKWADDDDKYSVHSGSSQSVLPIPLNDIDGSLLAVSSGGIAWVDSGSPSLVRKAAPASLRPQSPGSSSRASSVSEPRRLTSELSRTSLRSPLAETVSDNQPKILGLFGGPRKPFRDELDDDEEVFVPVNGSKRQMLLEPKLSDGGDRSPEGQDVDSESVSNVSTTSKSSRPETPSSIQDPSEAANKFLNLSTAAIDKAFKSRIQHRQSVTIKHGPLIAPPTPEKSLLTPISPSKTALHASPSQKVIQSIKLSQSRQKYKSTQSLAPVPPVTSQLGNMNFDTQDSEPQMRRATSMTNLGGDYKDRGGLDGYNSLLDRARARLSSTSGKTKSDVKPSSLSVTPRAHRASYSDVSSIKTEDNSAVNLLFPSKERSPFRSPIGSPVVRRTNETSQPSDSQNLLSKTLLERRIRRNSTTRPAEMPATTESPTASAIARIKAELGLSPTAIPAQPPTQNGVATNKPKADYLQAQSGLNLLTSATDSIIRNLNQISSRDIPASDKQAILSLYGDTLQLVRTKLDAAILSLVNENKSYEEKTESDTDSMRD